MTEMTAWISGIASALVISALLFVASEMRNMRLLITETFAKWNVHLFGMDGRGGITNDVRRLQNRARKSSFDDIEDHP